MRMRQVLLLPLNSNLLVGVRFLERNSCGGTEHAALGVSDLPEADARVAEGPDLFLNEMQSLWLGK